MLNLSACAYLVALGSRYTKSISLVFENILHKNRNGKNDLLYSGLNSKTCRLSY